MKLIYCPACQDIFKLATHSRECACGKTGGRYIDQLNAVIWGDGMPLGINNFDFARARMKTPTEWNKGVRFEAFYIPMPCPTIKRVNVMPYCESVAEGG